MRTIAIGDVHGCFEELENLLVKVKYDQGKDRLVFVGDLVDRGPHSGKCVKLARELGAEVVLGNHESKHLQNRKKFLREDREGKSSFPEDKLRTQRQLDELDIEFIRTWPVALSLGVHDGREWLAVHGGLEPGRPTGGQRDDLVIRMRWVDARGYHVGADKTYAQPEGTVFWTELYKGPYSVVYGHAVHSLQEPRTKISTLDAITVGIDTGCVFGGRLTAMLLPELDFVQVEAKRTYWTAHKPI